MIRKSGMKYFLYLLNTSSCASVMKTKISIIISAILVLSCGNNWQSDETDNIVLSEFSKELISLYLQDSIVLSLKEAYDEITLCCFEVDSHMVINIWENHSQQYRYYCTSCYVGDYQYLGRTFWEGKTIRFFGKENQRFFIINGNAKKQGRCRTINIEYDPLEWYLFFNKDYSLNHEYTNLVYENRDLSVVDSLVSEHFGRNPGLNNRHTPTTF